VIDVHAGDEIVYHKSARAPSGTRTGKVVRVTGRFVFVLTGSKRPRQIPRDRVVSVKETAG